MNFRPFKEYLGCFVLYVFGQTTLYDPGPGVYRVKELKLHAIITRRLYSARNPQQVCYRLVPADIRMRSRRLLRLEANKSAVCYKLSACSMKVDCHPGNKSFAKAKNSIPKLIKLISMLVKYGKYSPAKFANCALTELKRQLTRGNLLK